MVRKLIDRFQLWEKPRWFVVAFHVGWFICKMAGLGFFFVGFILFLRFAVVEAVEQEGYLFVVWGSLSVMFIIWLAAVLPNKPEE